MWCEYEIKWEKAKKQNLYKSCQMSSHCVKPQIE